MSQDFPNSPDISAPPRSGVIDGIEDTLLMSQDSPALDDMAGPSQSGVIDGIEGTLLMSQDSSAPDDMAGPSRSGVIDGIEDTQIMSQNMSEEMDYVEDSQLMSQGSTRKRDKRKVSLSYIGLIKSSNFQRKKIADSTRVSAKRQLENKAEKAQRLRNDATRSALRRSNGTEKTK